MKILFLADFVFEDLPGGSRVVARELARGLVRRGHDVTFLVRAKHAGCDSEDILGGAKVIRFAAPPGALGYVRAGREACTQLLKQQSFDCVHTHFAYSAMGPLQVIPKCLPHVRSFYGPWHDEGRVEDQKAIDDRRQNAGFPQTARSAAALHLRYALRAQVESCSLRRAQIAVVLSEQSQRELLALRFPAERIVKTAGGVDTGRFAPASDRAAVRASLGLPADRTVLLSVRRLVSRMGLDQLILALPAVLQRQPDALLLIGGQGPERAKLEALVTGLHLENQVRLLGFIPDELLASYYQSADVFVLPTVALEGFGLVTAEALACGLPVLGTAVGATPEILARLDRRLIVPNSSSAALAASILGFLEGGWRRDLTQERLRGLMLDQYHWGRHVEAVENIYESLHRRRRAALHATEAAPAPA